MSQRVGQVLERQRALVRDIEYSYLRLEALEGSAMDNLQGHLID